VRTNLTCHRFSDLPPVPHFPLPSCHLPAPPSVRQDWTFSRHNHFCPPFFLSIMRGPHPIKRATPLGGAPSIYPRPT
jgi:hypothetical protein